ncbi:MAG TPA: methylated-DNA--[protein]-cysteine S-methyltransferase [Pirellulales bacterium]|jgi:methylated-DNA-[protein]-cysteine S-methyltransferase|nr:methylated-DNA--[protein]-cysteine S-methyltransferase [Pirellulales bacterium]
MIAGARDTQLLVSVFDSELGWMALVENRRGVLGLKFGQPSPLVALAAMGFEPAMLGDVRTTGPLVRRLQAFARGRYDDFLDVPLELGRQTPFQRRVVAACRKIQPGRWRSYGELAAAAGAPRAARAVGSVMAANRIALLVPCHRVLRAGGRLGGYSLGSGLPLKQQLLDLERSMRPAKKPSRIGAKPVAAGICGAIDTGG